MANIATQALEPTIGNCAAAVGVGTELISKDALAQRDYAAIGALAKQFLAVARQARTR